jgi:hypothetical protein
VKVLVLLRTVIVVLALALVMLLALAFIVWRTGNAGSVYFDGVVRAVVALAAIAAGKSTVEHLANGGGVWGGVKALFTSAKPEGTPPAPPAGAP